MAAGTQGGKTLEEPPWLWREIRDNGRGDYLAVTSSYRIFRNKFLPSFLQYFERTGRARFWAGDGVIEIADPSGQFMATHSTDEMWARVLLGSAQSPGTLESATAKAAVCDEIGMDEFSLRAYQAIQRRLHVHQGRILMGTTLYNSGWFVQQIVKPAQHGGIVEVIEERGGEIEVTRNERLGIDLIQFDSVVNPAFSQEEYDRARATMAADEFAMFYRGRVGRPRTLIYDCFDEAVHKVPAFQPRQDWVRLVGIDPLGAYVAAIFLAWDPDREQIHAYDEYYEPFGLTTREHGRNVLERLGPVRCAAIVCGQPAERQARADFQSAGLPVIAPPFADVWVGIGRVYGLLKGFRLVVHSNCEHLLDEIGRYQRKRDANGEPTDQIEHKEDYHMCLAPGTLVATRRGHVPIEEVTTEDWALTRKGWRRVLAAGCTGIGQQAYEATLSDGRTLTGTADHPLILADGRRIPLHVLRYDDIIISEESCKQRRLQSTASASSGILTRIGAMIASITKGMCQARASATCIAISGAESMGQSRTGIMSIIWTVIRSITPWRILSACLEGGICPSTANNGMRSTQRSRLPIGPRLSRPRRLGIALQRARRGIARTASCLGRCAIPWAMSVSSVAHTSLLSSEARSGSAPMPASQHGDAPRGLTTRSVFARPVARHSGSTSTGKRGCAPVHVVAVRHLEASSRVYNLTVDGEHEFFANGILVANCDSLRYACSWLTEPSQGPGELVYQPAMISSRY